ncbi:MAG: glycosyltransferase [Kineosporiaceae bacterium]
MRLTIVMPAYNEADTIRSAVEHVLAVDYGIDVELIVVDDGSRDGTVAELVGLDDPRLLVHQHARNRGKGLFIPVVGAA